MINDKIFIYEYRFPWFRNSKKILKEIDSYTKKEKLNSLTQDFSYLTKSEIVTTNDKSQYKVFDFTIFYYKNGNGNKTENFSYDIDIVINDNGENYKFVKDIYNLFKFLQQKDKENEKFRELKNKYDHILKSEKLLKLVNLILEHEKSKKPSYANVEGIYYIMKYYNDSNDLDLEKILSYENEIKKDKLMDNPSYNLLLGCLFLDILKKFDFGNFFNMENSKKERISSLLEEKLSSQYEEIKDYLKKIKHQDSERHFLSYLSYLKKELDDNLVIDKEQLVQFMRFYTKLFIYLNFKSNQFIERSIDILIENSKFLKELKKYDEKNVKKYLFQFINVLNEELNDNNLMIFKDKEIEKKFYKFATTEEIYKNKLNELIKYYSQEINYFEILANFYKQLKNKKIKKFYQYNALS